MDSARNYQQCSKSYMGGSIHASGGHFIKYKVCRQTQIPRSLSIFEQINSNFDWMCTNVLNIYANNFVILNIYANNFIIPNCHDVTISTQ